jgi:hypothetical protein
MLFSLLLIGGTMVLVLVGAWRVRRYQDDIDAFEEREFRPPPAFSSPGWQ